MLGKQHQYIIDLLVDGRQHCSNEIPFRDYRRRVQDLIDGKNSEHKKYPIKKEPCHGRCGRVHGANVNWLWLETDKPVERVGDWKPCAEGKPCWHKVTFGYCRCEEVKKVGVEIKQPDLYGKR